MSALEKQALAWSTHDPACTHCRVRKIRCGRERPQCVNCKKDNVECDFSDFGKRVNHIKLLVNNVGELDNRLINIEKCLSSLTAFMEKGNMSFPSCITSNNEPSEILDGEQVGDALEPPADGHVVRCQSDGSYQYHGPCTLFALCKDFQDLFDNEHTRNAAIEGLLGDGDSLHAKRERELNWLLTTMCSSAIANEPFEANLDARLISLPPKPFLVMSCSSFFQQDDPVVDVFCKTTFWQNVHRVYSKPLTPADEPWALCFSVIILLVLGAGQADTKSSDMITGSQFMMPLIQTIRYAVACPTLFMTPRLINVQALALLSIAAQHYLKSGVAEVILAQACLLAKRMGLHQHQRRPHNNAVTSEEEEERRKVFISLFLRDTTLSISRGMSCCFQTSECNISVALDKEGGANMTMVARFQLARLQEKVCQSLYSSESFQQPALERKRVLLQIERSFQTWREQNDVDNLDFKSSLDVKMEFYSYRIVALRLSSDQAHKKQVIQDARKICELLCIPEEIIEVQGPSHLDGQRLGTKTNSSPGKSPTVAANQNRQSEPRIRSIVESFSCAAIFALAENIIWPVLEGESQKDIELLHLVCEHFLQLDLNTQANNYTRKVSQALKNLLAIVRVLKPELFPSSEHSQSIGDQSHCDQSFIFDNSSMSGVNSSTHSNLACSFPSLTFSGATSTVSVSNNSNTNLSGLNQLDTMGFPGAYHQDLGHQGPVPPERTSQKRQRLNLADVSNEDSYYQQMFSFSPDRM